MDAQKIAELIAEYLDNRDDIASAEVDGSGGDVTVSVMTQGGSEYLVGVTLG